MDVDLHDRRDRRHARHQQDDDVEQVVEDRIRQRSGTTMLGIVIESVLADGGGKVDQHRDQDGSMRRCLEVASPQDHRRA